MSIYSFSDIELQAYKNIWIAIQNYDVHAELPVVDIGDGAGVLK